MLLSQKRLCQLLGLLWYIDGVLQLQPQMFTTTMVNQVMVSTWPGQPALIEISLRWIMMVMMRHLIVMNLLIAAVQLGIGFCLYSGRWVKKALLVSVAWSLLVWYGGEGMSMVLTGQASALTGAPGAVLLYPLLGLVLYLRSPGEAGRAPRLQVRWLLAGFWLLAALLQMQPFWWQDGAFSDLMGSMVGLGGLNAVLLDPTFQWLSTVTAQGEIVLNSVLVLVFLGLGLSLALLRPERLRPALVASIVVSVVIWWFAQGFGMIFTGLATDFNSGPLLIIMALACWYKAPLLPVAPEQAAFAVEMRETSQSV